LTRSARLVVRRRRGQFRQPVSEVGEYGGHGVGR
jgi:hypothetical protein